MISMLPFIVHSCKKKEIKSLLIYHTCIIPTNVTLKRKIQLYLLYITEQKVHRIHWMKHILHILAADEQRADMEVVYRLLDMNRVIAYSLHQSLTSLR